MSEYLNDNQRNNEKLLKSILNRKTNVTVNHNNPNLNNSYYDKHLQYLLDTGLVKKHPVTVTATGYDLTARGENQLKQLNQAQAQQDSYNRRYLRAFRISFWVDLGLFIFGAIVLLLSIFVPLYSSAGDIQITLSASNDMLIMTSAIGLDVLLFISSFICKAIIKHHFHVGSWKKVSSKFYWKNIIGDD